jgi:thioredoxin reductase (NADPH)
VQESIFLTRFATHIDLLVRSTIKASEILQHDLQKYIDEGKITVHLGVSTEEILATDGKVSGVRATDNGKEVQFNADGVFVFVGLVPNTGFLKDSGVELDVRGLVKTNERMETSIPGIFASGDVRSGATLQIASAVGEGATAALSMREYLEGNKLEV